jgi:preprotein translocase subunit YajC
MSDWLMFLVLFAQEAGEKAPAKGAPQQPPGGGLLMWLFPLMLIFLLWSFLFNNPQKREQKRIEQLKSTLKKNDPVVTAGGILGTIANIFPERNEVVVKVDDNTKLRMRMTSIYPAGPESPAETKTEPETKA